MGVQVAPRRPAAPPLARTVRKECKEHKASAACCALPPHRCWHAPFQSSTHCCRRWQQTGCLHRPALGWRFAPKLNRFQTLRNWRSRRAPRAACRGPEAHSAISPDVTPTHSPRPRLHGTGSAQQPGRCSHTQPSPRAACRGQAACMGPSPQGEEAQRLPVTPARLKGKTARHFTVLPQRE